MYAVTFVLFGRKADGSIVELFRWCRDEASGLRRAAAEAERFGMAFEEIWAVPA